MRYRLLRSLLKLISSIPFGILYAISDLLAFVVCDIARYRRKVVRRNLTESFPELAPAAIRRIEKDFYSHFTDNILETCKMATITPQEMMRRMRFPNVESVNALLRQGRPVALFLGHYGNWEWISSMPLWLEKSATAAQIYHTLSSPAVDRLMLWMRSRQGAVNVEMRRTAHFIVEQAAAGRTSIIGFIADQSPRRNDARHFLPFLNHCTPVITGTEKITKRYGYEAYFVEVTRPRRGFYEARFVKMCDNPAALPDYELTALYYRHLEQAIKACPEMYLWTHNRFKYARPGACDNTLPTDGH